MRATTKPWNRAFLLTELLTLLVVIGVGMTLLTVASGAHRRRSYSAGSTSNLQKFASGITSYGADNYGGVASFTWRAGEAHEYDGYSFPVPIGDMTAGANQAVEIMRRRDGRTDIGVIRDWFAHISYNHLPLIDYLDQPLLAEFAVSPADRIRLAWQAAARNNPGDNGAAFFALVERPGGVGNDNKRWPYMSSYAFGPAFFAPDAVSASGIRTVAQDQSHYLFYTGTAQTPFGRRRLDEVAFPGQKAMVYETYTTDMGSQDVFFADPRARTLILFADGSASVRSMQHANRGFQPNNPFATQATVISYQPNPAWEPPGPGSGFSTSFSGAIRWTRSGLRGRDFNGPEIPWR